MTARQGPPARRFEWPVRVYWEDTDAGGIVFYANYLKFLERARTEWLRSLGIEQRLLREETGGIFVVTEPALKSLRPARLDDRLTITAVLSQIGQVAMTLHQQALLNSEHNSPPVVLCEGSIRIAWVDAATLRPARLPITVLEKFG